MLVTGTQEHLVKNIQKERHYVSSSALKKKKEPKHQMKDMNMKWHPRKKTEHALKRVSKLWIYSLAAPPAPAHTHYLSVRLLLARKYLQRVVLGRCKYPAP